jgi:lysophospholipase L1-like esterase
MSKGPDHAAADTGKTRARMVVRRLGMGLLCLILLVGAGAFGFLCWQGSREVDNSGEYVALGSSFAAGIGLGPRAPGSPLHCLRTAGGYPAQVARQTGLRLVDMSCSGSRTDHILDGGQLMLGPQLAAVGPGTRLVTITTGGNDLDYIGDLMAASGGMGRLGAWLHGDIKPAAARPYATVAANLQAIIRRIRELAPDAEILIVSYPALLPPEGTCAALGIGSAQAEVSREVAQRLSELTRQAAVDAGARLIDMDAASLGHDACSSTPWVHGATAGDGTPFHPNETGAAAVADRIVEALQG